MISAIVEGVEYSLDDGTYSYYLGEDGTGMMPLHRLETRGPLQHGSTDRGYRGDPRFIRLFLAVDGSTRNDAYAKRQQLLNIFRPTNGVIKLRWDLDTDYQIDTYFAGEMAMPSADRQGFYQQVVIELKAPDPTFYSTTSNAVTFQLGGGDDLMTVPTLIPMEVGTATIDDSTAIEYGGSFISFPTLIRIVGPITSPVITNTTTDEKLDFTGTTISAGDYYDIDLRYGAKTVVNSSGTSKVNTLTEDSDLATFHLVPAPDGSSTYTNSIQVEGSNATSATRVEFVYQNRYVGI